MSSRRLLRRALAGASLSFAVTVLASCGSSEFRSSWRTREITPDGRADDWGELTTIKSLKSDVGVVNDDSTLYAVVVIRDPELERHIVASGLDVWLDGTGGKTKRFGIRFPFQFQRGAGGHPGEGKRGQGEGQRQPAEGGSREGQDAGDWAARVHPGPIEILGDSTVDPVPLDAASGVRGAIAFTPARSLVCEIAVPLHRDPEHPQAIDVSREGVIGVGLEAPARQRPQGGPPGTGGGGWGHHGGWGGGGGHGGFGGMGGHGGYGGMGHPPGGALEDWSAWGRVQLAHPQG